MRYLTDDITISAEVKAASRKMTSPHAAAAPCVIRPVWQRSRRHARTVSQRRCPRDLHAGLRTPSPDLSVRKESAVSARMVSAVSAEKATARSASLHPKESRSASHHPKENRSVSHHPKGSPSARRVDARHPKEVLNQETKNNKI